MNQVNNGSRPTVSNDLQERTLKVTNFNDQVTKDLLYELFVQCGPVRNVVFKPDFAFIEFDHKDSVGYALALMEDTCLFGQKLELQPKIAGPDTFDHLHRLKLYINTYSLQPRNWWTRFGGQDGEPPSPSSSPPPHLCSAVLYKPNRDPPYAFLHGNTHAKPTGSSISNLSPSSRLESNYESNNNHHREESPRWAHNSSHAYPSSLPCNRINEDSPGWTRNNLNSNRSSPPSNHYYPESNNNHRYQYGERNSHINSSNNNYTSRAESSDIREDNYHRRNYCEEDYLRNRRPEEEFIQIGRRNEDNHSPLRERYEDKHNRVSRGRYDDMHNSRRNGGGPERHRELINRDRFNPYGNQFSRSHYNPQPVHHLNERRQTSTYRDHRLPYNQHQSRYH